MEKMFSLCSKITLIFAIVVCIWLGDNSEATGREMFSAFVILLIGVFSYIQNVAYSEKKRGNQ